jgi:DNA-binding NarL/FixJ family response regulator
MRVLIISDDYRTQNAFQFALLRHPSITGVEMVATSEDLATRLETICPDIVLLDWELHDSPGFVVLAALRSAKCHPKILVISSQLDVERSVLRAGADAFISKSEPPDRLLALLHHTPSEPI